MALDAERRWCLTGTPIQNKLEDIGSLIKFIRVVPFKSNANFRRHIIEPLLTEAPNSGENLRLLLGSVCLRRTKRHLQVPEATFETVTLSLSKEEQILYSKILEMSERAFDDFISSKFKLRRYNYMFQAIARLRVLCNLGTFYQASTLNSSGPEVIGMGKSPTALQMQNEATCELCSCDIGTSDLVRKTSLSSSCLHLLCPECSAEHEYDYTQDRDEWRPQCVLCSRLDQSMDLYGTLRYPSVKPSSSPVSEDTPPSSFTTSMDAGHSTKLSAVLENIEDNMRDTKRFLPMFCFSSMLTALKHCLLGLENDVRSLRKYSYGPGDCLFPDRWHSGSERAFQNNR
jgi:hypothetical protein